MTLSITALTSKSIEISRTHMRAFMPYLLLLFAPVALYIAIIQLFVATNLALYGIVTFVLSLLTGLIQLWVSLAFTKETA